MTDRTNCEACCREIDAAEMQVCEACGRDGLGNCCVSPVEHGCERERVGEEPAHG